MFSITEANAETVHHSTTIRITENTLNATHISDKKACNL